MPLKLTSTTIDMARTRGREGIPAYAQLANHIRQAIHTGDLDPGDELPSAKEICERTGVSREPVLRALDVLYSEGLILRRAGLVTRVAERRKPRMVGPARYRADLARLRAGEQIRESTFVIENGAHWSDYSESPRRFAEEKPSPKDRELLRLDGDTIWRRRFVRRLWGQPFEIVASAIPMSVAAGTLLMDPDADPVPEGTNGILYAAGFDLHFARHTLVGRPPNAKERELLEMTSADWVWDLLETFTTADGTPVQAARTIMPQSSTILQFETDLSAE